MNFERVQGDIQTGDLFLIRRSRTVFGRLIRLITQSRYSHVGIAVWITSDGDGERLAVIEALEGHGVRLFPLDRYLEECRRAGCLVDWFRVWHPNVDRHKVARFALLQWGRQYARPWQFVWSWGRLSSAIRRRFHLGADLDADRWFCSELVSRALFYAGYQPEDSEQIDAALTDPGTVAMFPCLQRMGVLE